ncbi:DUF2834 domain-containing protein [uncultured Aliiroseovarius sp.]|uniref:DUF2834 domain-containing protein n=1 Tax=uncultured Aliiroseovarius sp. TaxID=1658783 RepID=UPI0026194B69|nr:DUF2834 domain-containing protein [uncultured Aliiroseovarius sp.]
MTTRQPLSRLRKTYLALAVIGAVVPGAYFAAWFAQNGLSLGDLFQAWRANLATRGATLDLLLAGVTLTVWIIAETSVRRNWSALWAIPATFLVGVSCGLPLYLFLRTRPI